MLKRRAVLAAITSAMAAAIAPVSALANTKQTRRDQLSELLGHNFRVANPTGEVTSARLVAVDDGPRCSGLDQFSAVFEGDDLAEGLHEVYHRYTGEFSASLMPSGEPESRQTRKRVFFSTFT